MCILCCFIGQQEKKTVHTVDNIMQICADYVLHNMLTPQRTRIKRSRLVTKGTNSIAKAKEKTNDSYILTNDQQTVKECTYQSMKKATKII